MKTPLLITTPPQYRNRSPQWRFFPLLTYDASDVQVHFNVFEPRQDLPANAGRKLRLCANHYLFIHPLHKSQVMKKRPIATAAPPNQRREWVMLWLTHLLIPWYSFLHFLRKPPSRHREKQSEARQSALASFTELSTLRKSTNYLSSG